MKKDTFVRVSIVIIFNAKKNNEMNNKNETMEYGTLSIKVNSKKKNRVYRKSFVGT